MHKSQIILIDIFNLKLYTNSKQFRGDDAMQKINLPVDECVRRLTEICSKLDIEYIIENNKNNPKLHTLRISSNGKSGMLRIYETSKGLTLDKTAGPPDKSLNNTVYDEFVKYKPVDKVINKSVQYILTSQEQIDSVKNSLLSSFSAGNGYNILQDTKRNEIYRLKIENPRSKETVNVIQFKTKTLQVVGLKYALWEDVCYQIEKEIKPPISDIISRLLIDETPGDSESSIDDKNISNNKDTVTQLITKEVAAYLYPYDLDVLVSTQCILSAKIKMLDYCPVLSPALRATEGFFKKILVYLDIVKAIDVNKSWDFGKVFDHNFNLKSDFHNKLSADPAKKEKQLDSLTKLCKQMWTFRNLISHSGPKPPLIISDFGECETRFKYNLELIKSSYNNIIR